MAAPLISVITPSFNRAALIGAAIDSVLAQGYSEFEHIVADGASTDGTLEVLRRYPHLRVLSQPDSGMYEAINRGLALAHGEIIGLLNTDDLYAPGALAAVAAAFAEHADAEAVVGGAETFTASLIGTQIIREDPPILPQEFWYRIIRGHPVTNAWFFSRAVFARIGALDAGYRFAGDREFLIRAALAGVRPAVIPMILYLYREHADSATISAEDSRQARRGNQRLAKLGEDICLQEGFLKRDDIPSEARRELRAAHSADCYRAAVTALYHRRFSLGWQAMRLGLRYDPLWPAVFVHHAWHRVLQEFGLREPI
jgi:glycosyltransferase involved in cell wall biosynthesis